MAKSNVPSIDEALAGMAKTGAPRVPVGKEVPTNFRNASADAAGPKPRPKGHSKDVNPAAGGAGHRSNVSVSGASYGIRAMVVKPNEPAAGMTQANGRLISSAVNRPRKDFDGGVSAQR